MTNYFRIIKDLIITGNFPPRVFATAGIRHIACFSIKRRRYYQLAGVVMLMPFFLLFSFLSAFLSEEQAHFQQKEAGSFNIDFENRLPRPVQSKLSVSGYENYYHGTGIEENYHNSWSLFLKGRGKEIFSGEELLLPGSSQSLQRLKDEKAALIQAYTQIVQNNTGTAATGRANVYLHKRGMSTPE